MSVDERNGFLYALDCIETWAMRIKTQADTAPPVPIDNMTLPRQMRSSADFTRTLAKGLRVGFRNGTL
ncbi:hypothetical protein [Roseovarius atlanticus]|uniref:hypothetical protein n=1 Tax=Roseovarius atlanticus TaxID=1641875 RepID=UPI001C97FB97|nr:hypothetical protein [Roseovarius atlanticus]MBY5988187.1 hypothetical protein [Roseovarius atlanticus]MBY6123578.1 hypothetical protein [Roseovarius atlanticus]MBY6148073.1 hypothetical protein [Roseovarius atlanticus]